MNSEPNALKRALPGILGEARNAAVRARNLVVDSLPGERPEWLVVELRGSYPARRAKRKLISLDSVTGKEREQSQEEFAAQVTALLDADWLKGVVLLLDGVTVGLSTAYALRRQVERLKVGGKRVVAAVNDLNTVNYYVATAAHEIVVPESAGMMVNGMSLTATFMADALARFGVRFEKLAIREYKNAGDTFTLPAMSEAQRRQYDALLDSMENTYLNDVSAGRGTAPTEVRSWIDRGVSSAREALELGMVDRLAYEDEFIGKRHKPLAAGARFLPARTAPAASKRVAVVSLEGNIVTGRSRRSPVPVPLFGETYAGSDTLVRALRAARRDESTAAVVFHVDSGGGSALASDLIWREVKLTADRKPVVAVMGQYAASGGYYVLTHATRVVAAPTTLTGSIGVVMLKPVLEEFNERYGFNPETLKRGRFADLISSAKGWDEAELDLLSRFNRNIYDLFVSRVAQGRGLPPERVNEIGRGRVWSGADALELGLVDELGDVLSAIALARELAGLPAGAPVWNVSAPQKLLLPEVEADEPRAWLNVLAPLLDGRPLLMHPNVLRIG